VVDEFEGRNSEQRATGTSSNSKAPVQAPETQIGAYPEGNTEGKEAKANASKPQQKAYAALKFGVSRICSSFNRNHGVWTALATIVMALTMIVYTIYAGRQWKEMQSSGGDTHDLAIAAGEQAKAAQAQSEQAKAQVAKMADLARAAKDQANAARTAAETAEQSFRFTREVVERPNVLFDRLDPQDFPGKLPKFLLTFRNQGRSLATNVIGNTTFGLRPGEIEDVFNFDRRWDFTLPPIPPNGIAQHWVTLPSISTEQMQAVVTGTTRLYVFGFVGYTYLGKDFCAEYCVVYNPIQAIRPTGISLFDYCTQHNQEKPCPKRDQRPN